MQSVCHTCPNRPTLEVQVKLLYKQAIGSIHREIVICWLHIHALYKLPRSPPVESQVKLVCQQLKSLFIN